VKFIFDAIRLDWVRPAAAEASAGKLDRIPLCGLQARLKTRNFEQEPLVRHSLTAAEVGQRKTPAGVFCFSTSVPLGPTPVNFRFPLSISAILPQNPKSFPRIVRAIFKASPR
jgi:hypothetical protein